MSEMVLQATIRDDNSGDILAAPSLGLEVDTTSLYLIGIPGPGQYLSIPLGSLLQTIGASMRTEAA